MHVYIKPNHPHKYIIDLFNFSNILKYAAAAGRPIKIYTRTRTYIGNYKAIDRENPPIILKSFWISGSLIYTRSGYYSKCIGYDDIIKIEVQENAAA